MIIISYVIKLGLPFKHSKHSGKKVHVGDFDIAYKTFDKDDFILLVNDFWIIVNDWEPSDMGVLRFAVQALTVTNPKKVSRLILVAASCGGRKYTSRPQLAK